MKKLLLAATAVAFLPTAAIAQNSASATADATATIIAPIAISKTADLNFGVIVAQTAANSVTVTPAGARSSTNSGLLTTQTGTVTAASFSITGEPTYTYTISLPSSVTLSSGSNTMTFAPAGSLTGAQTLGSGATTYTVGGTLSVAPNQAAGVYTNTADLTVTVAYQ